MGVYSHYSSYVEGTELVADESYVGAAGAYQMMEESCVNENNIFNAVIGRDFCEELNKISPSLVSESQMEAINEASLSGIWAKVKEAAKKIWEKILGILKTIKDKIQSVFIRDGKELVKKYEKQINKKMNDGKLTKMKFKWCEKNGSFASGNMVNDVSINLEESKLYDKYSRVLGRANVDNFNHEKGEGKTSIKAIQKVSAVGDEQKNELYRPFTADEKIDMAEDAYGKIVGGKTGSSVTSKEFQKEFMEANLQDEDEKEGLTSTLLTEIKEALTGAKTHLKDIEKEEKKQRDKYKDTEKRMTAIEKKYANLNGKEGYTDAAAGANRTASKTLACLSIISTVNGAAYAACTAVLKKYLKQCRSVYIKAATYNQKESAYEAAITLEAVGDVSDYEVEEMFSTLY